MKTCGEKILALVLGTATAALASEGGATGGLSPLVIGFLAFFALIVAFQAIPGVVMLVSVLRGLLAGMLRSRLPAGGDEMERRR